MQHIEMAKKMFKNNILEQNIFLSACCAQANSLHILACDDKIRFNKIFAQTHDVNLGYPSTAVSQATSRNSCRPLTLQTLDNDWHQQSCYVQSIQTAAGTISAVLQSKRCRTL